MPNSKQQIAMYFLFILFVSGASLGLTLFFQPRSLLKIAASIIPGVVYFAETDRQIVALTIDDGPDPNTTAKILEVLSENEAKATFFLISNRVKGNEAIVNEIVSQGHEIGNHLTEDKPSIKLSPAEFEADLLEADEILSQFSKPLWLRPASGWYDRQMIETANKYNYRVALGSIFPYDTNINSSDFASKHILVNLSPGSIIVLHDGGLRGENTVKTLTNVLPELRRRGYEVVTLTELFTN
ncbi:MAG: chitin deacetylase family protein [Prochloraceae cyanobacterium]|nr:chitin deacetylase family protein [Prochloraceae cyanobacterium]